MPPSAPLGHLPRSLRAILMATIAAVYVVLTFLVTPLVGDLAAGVVIPVLLLAALFYGTRGVAIAYVGSLPISFGMDDLVGHPIPILREGFAAFLGLMVAGGFVGLLRLWARLRHEVEARNASEARFAATFRSAAVGTMILGADGRVEKVNETYCNLTGWTQETAIGFDFASDRSPARAAIERDLAEHGRSVYTSELPRADGTTWWGEWHTAYVVGPKGPEGAIVQVIDITGRKLAEEAVRRSERLAAVGTLVAGVAHEINNPLMFIRGNIELVELGIRELRDGGTVSTKEADAMLAKLQRSVEGLDGLRKLAKDLRKVARPPTAAKKAEDLNEIVRSVTSVAHGDPPRELTLDLGAQHPVVANAEEVRQVVLNLVLNALDAVAQKGASVTLRTRDAGARVWLEVTDDGPGIPPDVAPKLFTPFFTTKAQGTGLGLTISHAIAREHGGDLSFVSAPGRTTFRLELPAAKGVSS